jgi:hypothetical protein
MPPIPGRASASSPPGRAGRMNKAGGACTPPSIELCWPPVVPATTRLAGCQSLPHLVHASRCPGRKSGSAPTQNHNIVRCRAAQNSRNKPGPGQYSSRGCPELGRSVVYPPRLHTHRRKGRCTRDRTGRCSCRWFQRTVWIIVVANGDDEVGRPAFTRLATSGSGLFALAIVTDDGRTACGWELGGRRFSRG